jgi:FlaG/FlaF family flagellin (archaellin)
MVAITVIMAAIIAGAIFGMEPPADVPHMSYTIEINEANSDLTHMGGEQVKVSELKFMADGVEVFNTTDSSELKFMADGVEVFNTTDSEINNTEIWKIGTTITLNTTNDIMIVHLPSKELL